MRFASIDGVTLHYEHRKRDEARPLVVFVNSLGTDFRIWDAVLPHLIADFSILRYDKRGHGLSDLGDPPYSIADHIADLAGLINRIEASDVVICGLSVGGLIAQGFLAKHPEIVRALVLCDTAHKIGTAESWNVRIAAVTENGIASIADGVLEKWFTPTFHGERPDELAGCRNMLVRQPAEGYAGTCAALRDADHTEIVKLIAVPTLCLVGDQDGSTPPDLVKSMAELIPGAEFGIIPEAGHIPCVEQPAELAKRIKAFLQSNGVGANGHG